MVLIRTIKKNIQWGLVTDHHDQQTVGLIQTITNNRQLHFHTDLDEYTVVLIRTIMNNIQRCLDTDLHEKQRMGSIRRFTKKVQWRLDTDVHENQRVTS